LGRDPTRHWAVEMLVRDGARPQVQ